MDEKKFKVYKSAAGSGKTYTLVKEYLKIVLENPWKYNRILAITFTNKAANEMKSRIIDALSEISLLVKDSTEGLLQDLKEETGLSYEEIKDNAKKVLQNILHNYSDFAISTIDSFTHKIVRTFAFDLQIPLNFNIELDGEMVISQAVDALMEKIGEDEKVTKILFEFMQSKIQDDKSWHIDRDLKDQAKQLHKEDIEKQLLKIKDITVDEFVDIAGKQRNKNHQLKKEIQEIGKSFFKKIQSRGLSESDFYQGSRGICGLFSKIEKFDGKEITMSKTLQQMIENCSFSKPKGNQIQNELIDEITPKIIESIQDFFNKQNEYISRKLFIENIYAVAVLNELNNLLQEQSNDEKFLHISEFNKKISKVVLEEPVPFIYERLGERYQHYLIDEFQDTSVLQWQNLLPLLENGLSQNHFSMIVGDSKQAIYRFRQGEVEQFESLPEIYQKNDNHFLSEREQTLKMHYELDVLKYNYRSRKTIVEFNNEFFKIIAKNYLGERYQKIFLGDDTQNDPGVEQKYKKENGYLSLSFIGKENYQEDTCEKIFQAIQESIAEGFSMKDICILTRNNKELNVISEYLSQKTIGKESLMISSDESLKLQGSSKIRLILSVLQYLNQPTAQTPQLHILEYLQETGKIKQKDINQFFIEKKVNFETFMKKKGYDFLKLSEVNTSLYDTCERIIRFFDLNKPSDIYITSFLNYVTSFSIKNEQNISSFLEWFMENQDTLSAKSSDEMNAVHLMTIHKSKGLGYPVVIYPFADSKCNTTFDLWMDTDENIFSVKTGLITTKKEIASSCFAEPFYEEREKAVLDMVNVLYVALTRPKDRLYIFCEQPSEKDETVSYPSMFRKYLVEKMLFDENTKEYNWGEKKSTHNKEQNELNEKALSEIISTDWTERPISDQRKISVKELIIAELYTEKGLLIHEALSYIINVDDKDFAIKKLLDKGLIDEDEKESFEKRVNHLISHPAILPFFNTTGKVKTEAEIITATGNNRIDRLIFEEDKTFVIDFKTGLKRKEHLNQMETYCDILKKMNFPNVEGFLVYLNEEEPEVINL